MPTEIDHSNFCLDIGHQIHDVFPGELAERIWCLYIFHVCGAQMIHGTCGA